MYKVKTNSHVLCKKNEGISGTEVLIEFINSNGIREPSIAFGGKCPSPILPSQGPQERDIHK